MERRVAPVRATATIGDVARRAGVSQATAARALGDYGSVSARARERVVAAAEELGYRRNEVARTMITGRSNTVGLVVADIEHPFFAAAAHGVSDVARAAGFEVVLVNTDGALDIERSAVHVLEAKRIDGLIVAAASPTDVAHLESVRQGGCPVVLIDRQVDGLDSDAVIVDNVGAATDIVTRLLAAGHRHVAMVTGGVSSADPTPPERPIVSTGRERVDGYLAALTEAGVPDPRRLLRTGAYDRTIAHDLTLELLELEEPPTAVFASDSTVAIGVLTALREAGVTVPNEMSLVTFDDADWTSVVSPPVSVVAQPAQDLGRRAAEVLLARLEGLDAPPETYVLDTTFVARGSIGAPRTGPLRTRRSVAGQGAIAPSRG